MRGVVGLPLGSASDRGMVRLPLGSASDRGMVGLPLGSASEGGDRVVGLCYRVVVQQYVISNPDCV